MAEKSGYTIGEIRTIIAPLIGENPEDIDDYIIITKGKCHDCGGRDGWSTTDSACSDSEFRNLFESAVIILQNMKYGGQ